jgi:glycosyltransferase involved in cell wall biosynthesis
MLGWEFPPYFAGGAGMVCYELTKAMSKMKDLDITYVMPFGPDELNNSHVKLLVANNLVSDSNIKLRKVNAMFKAYDSLASYSKRLKEIKKLIKQKNPAGFKKKLYGDDLLQEVYRFAEKVKLIGLAENFDVVHAHDWTTFPAAIALKKETGKPFVAHVHITEFDKSGGLGANPDIYAIEQKGMKEADLVITVSEFMKKNISERYFINPNKIKVVHNGRVTMKKPKKKIFRKKDDDKLVLFAGRVTLQKGPEFFLDAAKKVLEKEKRVKFVMAGSGDMLNRMIEKSAAMGMADKFLFTGFYTRKQAEQLFSMADVFVMPSVSEPFGIVPLEAMYKGTPAIISKQSGCSEVLKNTLKVDFWDIDEMANKIISVVRHSPLKETMSQNGLIEMEKMGWESPAQKCMDAYSQVIKW